MTKVTKTKSTNPVKKVDTNLSIEEQQKKALKRLWRMKVASVMNDDYVESENESYFDFVWWQVLHEYDLFIEGECDDLTKAQAETAKRWLKETQHLTIEHKNMKL